VFQYFRIKHEGLKGFHEGTQRTFSTAPNFAKLFATSYYIRHTSHRILFSNCRPDNSNILQSLLIDLSLQ